MEKYKESANFFGTLNQIFKIDASANGGDDDYTDQDWDLVAADGDRVVEFLDTFESSELDDKQRYAAVSMIVASYDLYLSEEEDNDDEVWDRIEAILIAGGKAYNELTKYWASTRDGGWDITPRMQDFRRAHPFA